MRIVCIGDSLTACGGEGGLYTDHLQTWLPDHTVINKGIGGDTLGGGRRRFQKDVMTLHPDVVIIALGANDFWQANRPISQLQADLEAMVSSARKSGAQVVIASCFGHKEYDSTTLEDPAMKKRSLYARAIADFESNIVARYGCCYVPDMQIDIRPKGNARYWSDTNHPNKAGNAFVARRILQELQKALATKRCKPHPVSSD